jgi:hypothetical protein
METMLALTHVKSEIIEKHDAKPIEISGGMLMMAIRQSVYVATTIGLPASYL